MPDAAADASEQPGNGRSNSLEPRAVRYELFVGNRTSSFDERKSTCGAGNLSFRLRRAALGIHGRCERLRAAQNLHRDLPTRRRLLRCSWALSGGPAWCTRRARGSISRIRERFRLTAFTAVTFQRFNDLTIQRRRQALPKSPIGTGPK